MEEVMWGIISGKIYLYDGCNGEKRLKRLDWWKWKIRLSFLITSCYERLVLVEKDLN